MLFMRVPLAVKGMELAKRKAVGELEIWILAAEFELVASLELVYCDWL
jgi:hypothetical protein